MARQKKSEQAFLEFYMRQIDSPITCEVTKEMLEKLDKQKVPLRKSSNIYKIIKRSNKTSQDICELNAPKFLKRLVFDTYNAKPDFTTDDVLMQILKDYENIDKLICSVCQISPFDLDEYLKGKRYPYLCQPINTFFSRVLYDEYLRIKAFDQEVKQFFTNESICKNEPSEDELYEDLKIQVLMKFLEIRTSGKSWTFDNLINMLKDTNNWNMTRRITGRWSYVPVYRVMTELIGKKFTGDIRMRHIIAPLVVKTFGITLTY